jgi:hypothetical protein
MRGGLCTRSFEQRQTARQPLAGPTGPCNRAACSSEVAIRTPDIPAAVPWLIRALPPAVIVTLSNRIDPTAARGRVAMGRHEMDASVLIGAPLGFGILLALGILMVAVSYLSQ